MGWIGKKKGESSSGEGESGSLELEAPTQPQAPEELPAWLADKRSKLLEIAKEIRVHKPSSYLYLDVPITFSDVEKIALSSYAATEQYPKDWKGTALDCLAMELKFVEEASVRGGVKAPGFSPELTREYDAIFSWLKDRIAEAEQKAEAVKANTAIEAVKKAQERITRVSNAVYGIAEPETKKEPTKRILVFETPAREAPVTARFSIGKAALAIALASVVAGTLGFSGYRVYQFIETKGVKPVSLPTLADFPRALGVKGLQVDEPKRSIEIEVDGSWAGRNAEKRKEEIQELTKILKQYGIYWFTVKEGRSILAEKKGMVTKVSDETGKLVGETVKPRVKQRK